MSEKEYVYVVNNGMSHQQKAEEFVFVVNSGTPDPPSAEKTVFVVNRMRGLRPSICKNVHVVNDGSGWTPSISRPVNVFVENLDGMPANIRVAWGMLRCPRCNGKLKIYLNDYGCDFCEITFYIWELDRL